MLRRKYLIGCLGLLWMGSMASALSPWALAESSPEAKVAVPDPAAATPQPNVDEAQRAEAGKHIPELVFFISIAVTMGLLLRFKAQDLEKLRREGFFRDPDQPEDPH